MLCNYSAFSITTAVPLAQATIILLPMVIKSRSTPITAFAPFIKQFTISSSRALSFACSVFQAIRLEPTPKRSLKEAPNSEKNPVPRTICPLITLRYLTILYPSKLNPDVVKNVFFSSGRLSTILLCTFKASSNSFLAASAAFPFALFQLI